MPLVSSTPLLQAARQNGYGIGAFNVHTLEMLQAVVEAAEETDSPLILQSTVGTVNHLGADYLVAAATAAADRSRIPIALHLDHCTDFAMIVHCIRAGYTSVMIDVVFSNAIKELFANNPDENDPRKYMIPAKKAVKAAAMDKMRMLGCFGKAADSR